MRLIIAGAGIVGLSLARSAIDRGMQVTLLEQASVPNPNCASFDEHRLIRFQYAGAAGYAAMVVDAFAAWERLWTVLGKRHFVDTGSLSVSLREGDYSDLSRQTLERLGLPYDLLSEAALRDRYPHLRFPVRATGLLCKPGGGLFADRIVNDLARHVVAMGAEVVPNCRAVAVDDASGTVTTADGRRFSGDLVVVSAGAWLDQLLPDEFPSLPTKRQVLCYVRPPKQHAESWARGPALVVIGDANVYSLPPADGTGLKFGCGDLRTAHRPEHGFDAPVESGRRAIEAFRPYIADADDFVPVRVKVGYYVMDASRRFKLLRRNRRWIVTNCDGQMFKFGPLIGERLIAAIAGEASPEATESWLAGHG